MVIDPLLICWCDWCDAYINVCDPNMVTIYWTLDDIENLVEAICECGSSMQERLDANSITRLEKFGVVKQHLNLLLPPITEREIELWDIDQELELLYGS